MITTKYLKLSSILSYLPQLSDAVDSTPVKLHTATDAIDPWPQHHDCIPREGQIMLCSAVCQVKVVGAGWPLCSHCVNLSDIGFHSCRLPGCPHCKLRTVNKFHKTVSAKPCSKPQIATSGLTAYRLGKGHYILEILYEETNIGDHKSQQRGYLWCHCNKGSLRTKCLLPPCNYSAQMSSCHSRQYTADHLMR